MSQPLGFDAGVGRGRRLSRCFHWIKSPHRQQHPCGDGETFLYIPTICMAGDGGAFILRSYLDPVVRCTGAWSPRAYVRRDDSALMASLMGNPQAHARSVLSRFEQAPLGFLNPAYLGRPAVRDLSSATAKGSAAFACGS